MPRWLDTCLAFKDRLLSSPRFQARAAAFALTRPIARRRARDLFDLTAGFVYSQVLLACTELRLFDTLLEAPLTLFELSRRLDLPEPGCARLVAAAISLRLIEERSGHRYGLGPLGAALARNPGLTAMIEHHRHLYADLRDPVALLRGTNAATELGGYWPYATNGRPSELAPEQVAAYSSLMALSQPMIAEEILDAYRLGRHRCLLDVGGGEGAFLAAAAAAAPGLRLMLFDLPAVAPRAEQCLRGWGLARAARCLAEISFPTRCQKAPISSRSCEFFSITRTARSWRSCAPCMPRSAATEPCSLPSRCPTPPAAIGSAPPTSGFTCWPWAAGAHEPVRK